MSPKLQGYLRRVLSHALFASLILLVMSFVDPLGLRTASTQLVRDAVERIFRTVPAAPGIWDWADPRVRSTADRVAAQIARRRGELVPEDGIAESDLGRYISKWTPIHLILFDELAASVGRKRSELDKAVLGLPIEEVTDLLAYLSAQGVSVIFIDIRFINDFSYDGDSCKQILRWNEYVRKPPGADEKGNSDDPRPYLFVAGQAPLVTSQTSELLWKDSKEDLPPVLEREARHTVLPCLSEVATVVQTEWQPVLGSYPITVNRVHDPFEGFETGEAEDIWRYAPAVEMLRAWCEHEYAVAGDLEACDWLRTQKAPQGPLDAMVMDWVHMVPAVYGRFMRERCMPADGPGSTRGADAPFVEQIEAPWTQWRTILTDMVEQFFLQTLWPVDRPDDRISDPQCIMPALWDGWLADFQAPHNWNSTFRNALFGSAVIIGTAYENGSDWHHSATAGMVPGARLHSVALQSLMWRGEDYLRDYEASGALNRLFALELGMMIVAIALFELLKHRPARCRPHRPLGLKMRDGGTQKQYADTVYEVVLFQVLFVLLVFAGWIVSRFLLLAPVPDILSIGFGIVATYSVRLVENFSDGLASLLRVFLAPRVFLILVVFGLILIPTAIALGGRDLYWQLWYLAMMLFGGAITLFFAFFYDRWLAHSIERK